MKMIAFVMAAAAVVVGCSTVHVPNTPAGQSCVRECMLVRNSCNAGCYGDNAGWCKVGCGGQQKDCLRSCPGATED